MQLSREGRVQRFIFSTFILAALAWPAWAQPARPATVSGRVLDPSGAVVPAAAVRIYSRDNAARLTTATSAQGDYRFERLPAGEYLIEARTEGLDQANPVQLHIAAGQDVKQDLTLDMRGLANRIEVTSTSTPQSTVEAGKAMDVVDRAELDQREVNSLTEALREVPGLRVQQLGGPGEFTRILTRGLPAEDTSLLVDGMRLRDVASPQGDSTAYLADVLLAGTDQLEVLRGSGSSLYGTNAIGGVINVVTDPGGGPFHGEIGGEGGGLGYGSGDVRLGGGLDHNQWQYGLASSFLNVTGGVGGIENFRDWSEQAMLSWRPDGRTALTLRVLAFETNDGIVASPYAAPDTNLPPTGIIPAIPLAPSQVVLANQNLPFSWGNATFAPNLADPDSWEASNLTTTMLSFQRVMSSRLTVRVSFQDLNGDRNYTNGPAGTGYQPAFNTTDYYRGRTDTLNARADIALSPHNLVTAGYEYEREGFVNNSLDANPDLSQRTNASTTVTQSSDSVFAQDQLRLIGDRLQFSLSGRITHYDLDAPTFFGGTAIYANAPLSSPANSYTGDASVSYFLRSSQTKLRAHAGNGYRSPSPYERFGTYFYGGSFYALGDPQLAPERTIALDFGFDQYFAARRLKLSSSYFYTRLQNVIAYGPTPVNDPYGRYGGYIDAGGGIARGVEVSGEARPWRSMILRASYVYTSAIEKNPQLIGPFLQSIRVFPHSGSLVATQELGKRMHLTASLLATSDYISGVFYIDSAGGDRPYLFPGPHRLDLALSYTLPLAEQRSLRFYAKVDNALNQTYYEDGFQTPKAWGSAGLKFLF